MAVTHRSSRSPLTWLGGLLALYLLVPLVAFLVRLGRTNQRGFTAAGLWPALRTSAEAATISTALIAVLGIPLAFWLARSRGPFARIVDAIVYLPLALPPVMSGIVLIYLVGPYTTIGSFFNGRLTDSLAGVVLAQTFVASPFLVVASRAAFANVDPALDDLAATLGLRPLERFFRVDVPAATLGIQAGLLLTWLRAVGEYGATVLLAYHPYTLPVFTEVQFAGSGLEQTAAPTALALALAGAALLITQSRVRPQLPRSARPLPAPVHPKPAAPVRVAFDLDVTVGTFRLRVAHRAVGHRVAILGPSGSGKSMTLRSLAGLLGAGCGTVLIDGEDISHASPPARHVGYVPQGTVLFPRRSVRRQVCFGKGSDPAVAAWWLRALGLEGFEDRRPDQLSGGQRQRVALAQALARAPRLVLLDEPFSGLDAPVRDELRRELRRLQRDNGLSTVLVTHDPEEAALLADEILVISDGRLLQAGPRREVYRRPASPEVARLLGIQNLLPGRVVDATTLATGDLHIAADMGDLPAGTNVLWSIRPEHAGYADASLIHPDAHDATVVDAADLGATTSITVRLIDGPEIRLSTTAELDPATGTRCRVVLDPARISVWPAAGSNAGKAADGTRARTPSSASARP